MGSLFGGVGVRAGVRQRRRSHFFFFSSFSFTPLSLSLVTLARCYAICARATRRGIICGAVTTSTVTVIATAEEEGWGEKWKCCCRLIVTPRALRRSDLRAAGTCQRPPPPQKRQTSQPASSNHFSRLSSCHDARAGEAAAAPARPPGERRTARTPHVTPPRPAPPPLCASERDRDRRAATRRHDTTRRSDKRGADAKGAMGTSGRRSSCGFFHSRSSCLNTISAQTQWALKRSTVGDDGSGRKGWSVTSVHVARTGQ